jgi:hypothetical protein
VGAGRAPFWVGGIAGPKLRPQVLITLGEWWINTSGRVACSACTGMWAPRSDFSNSAITSRSRIRVLRGLVETSLRNATTHGLTRNAGSETGRRFALYREFLQGLSNRTSTGGVSRVINGHGGNRDRAPPFGAGPPGSLSRTERQGRSGYMPDGLGKARPNRTVAAGSASMATRGFATSWTTRASSAAAWSFSCPTWFLTGDNTFAEHPYSLPART